MSPEGARLVEQNLTPEIEIGQIVTGQTRLCRPYASLHHLADKQGMITGRMKTKVPPIEHLPRVA